MITKLPKLANVERYTKYAEFLHNINKIGFGNIEITDEHVLKKIDVPEFLYHFAAEHDIILSDLINTIVRDFILRMQGGNSKYEKGILKKIWRSTNLSEKEKGRILKIVLTKAIG